MSPWNWNVNVLFPNSSGQIYNHTTSCQVFPQIIGLGTCSKCHQFFIHKPTFSNSSYFPVHFPRWERLAPPISVATWRQHQEAASLFVTSLPSHSDAGPVPSSGPNRTPTNGRTRTRDTTRPVAFPAVRLRAFVLVVAEESSKWIMGSPGGGSGSFLDSQSVCRDAAAAWWCAWGRTMVLNDANSAWWRRSCCVERSRGQEVLARRTPHPAVSVLNAKSYIVSSLVSHSVRFGSCPSLQTAREEATPSVLISGFCFFF